MSFAELESILETIGVPRRTADQAATYLARLGAVGVSRLYLNPYAPLSEIDTDEVDLACRLLAR